MLNPDAEVEAAEGAEAFARLFKFGRGAVEFNLAVFDKDDAVEAFNVLQVVGNHDERLIFRNLEERLKEGRLCNGVKTDGGFVKQDGAYAGKEDTRERNAMTFAS